MLKKKDDLNLLKAFLALAVWLVICTVGETPALA
jgi:hypothetical protein